MEGFVCEEIRKVKIITLTAVYLASNSSLIHAGIVFIQKFIIYDLSIVALFVERLKIITKTTKKYSIVFKNKFYLLYLMFNNNVSICPFRREILYIILYILGIFGLNYEDTNYEVHSRGLAVKEISLINLCEIKDSL